MSNFDENSESQKYWNEDGGNKWADNIDVVESFIEPLSNRLINELAARNGEHVLDVGCGGGVTSLQLSEQVGMDGSVLGVDVSAPILVVARKRSEGIENLDFQQGDAASAELGEDKFDIITSRFGVMFFDDPVVAFRNLHRALKTTGRLVFLCWRSPELNPCMAAPAKAAFEILPPPEDVDPPDPTAPGPFSLADAAHLESVLTSAGFNDVDLQEVDMLMPLGELDSAVSFLMKMGPAAEVIENANASEKDEVARAMTAALSKYETDDGIMPPSAAWLVNASK